jgi:hypothetical protein
MARQRRGGFKPPELRGTLGTLLRTAVSQAGVVRDAIERGTQNLRTDRRRQEALAELGEVVLELVRNGEIDLGELPEARSIIAHLDELDGGEGAPDEALAPRSRRRFDDRERAAADDGTVSAKTWQPPNRRSGKPTNVWRPREAAEPVAAPRPPRDPARKGGIQFADDPDPDDDLADYMHPDDVPSKPEE